MKPTALLGVLVPGVGGLPRLPETRTDRSVASVADSWTWETG